MTNKEYQNENIFKNACSNFYDRYSGNDVVNTKRQASKFRRGKGRVYKFMTSSK